MFWPIELPFQITLALLAGLTLLFTVLAPRFKWKRMKTLRYALGISIFAFVPSCIVIMMAVDTQRFGVFVYESFAEIEDFRARRYLPPEARQITIQKFASGTRSRYTVDSEVFLAFIEGLWDTDGENSAIAREDLERWGPQDAEASFLRAFGDLGWEFPPEAVRFRSPVQPNGGGAEYFLQKSTGTVFQATAFW